MKSATNNVDPNSDDWDLHPIFDRWPDWDLYDPNDGDGESNLCVEFERLHHYLCDRAATTGEPYNDTAFGLTGPYIMRGERLIHGVWVDEGGKMICDTQDPQPGYFATWNREHVVDAFAAANVRLHAEMLIEIAQYVPEPPSAISTFVKTLVAHVPNRAARPTLRDAAARIAQRIACRAELLGLTLERLLAASNVADELRRLMPERSGARR